MMECPDCAQALPIAACPTSIQVGSVAEGAPPIAVRFTDRATGRVTIAEVDESELPLVVAITPIDFAPGHAVMVEVVNASDDVIGAPIEFFPLLSDGDGAVTPSAYPVGCIIFTPIKSFGVDGSVYPAGPRTLIIES